MGCNSSTNRESIDKSLDHEANAPRILDQQASESQTSDGVIAVSKDNNDKAKISDVTIEDTSLANVIDNQEQKSKNSGTSNSALVVDEGTPIWKQLSAPPMMKGFLFKQGRELVKTWKKRFFVLIDGVLKYYESPTVELPYGHICKGTLDLVNFEMSKKDSDILSTEATAADKVASRLLKASQASSEYFIHLISIHASENDLLLKCEKRDYTCWKPALEAHISYAHRGQPM